MIIRQDNYGNVNVVENDKYQYAVTNDDGEIIVPFGKYGWISGFDHGLARVKDMFGMYIDLESGEQKMAKWGIINESGQEVLPLICENIWNFFQKGRSDTKVVINGEDKKFDLNTLSLSDYYRRYSSYDDVDSDNDYYVEHYDEYAGSYAQDVMGYSDEYINDAFDGEPDAYWNID